MQATTNDQEDRIVRRMAEEIADPRRLRRESARWEGMNEATRFARFVVLQHGGRRRPIIHRGSRHLRSRVVSRKTRRLQVSEGKGLRFMIQRCEIDGIVIDYEAHPFLIQAIDAGRRLEWYPDLVWVRRGERPHLVEIKTDISALENPEYLRKLEVMMEVARRIGWTMQVLYDEDVFGSTLIQSARWKNVNAIHSRRYLTPTPAEAHAVASLAAARARASWAAARTAIAPNDAARGDAVIEWAVSRGIFAVDPDAPFTPWTVLTPLPAALPAASIRI